MKRFSAEPALADLKDFQRATVDHVLDRFFGPNPTRRFLVADETGLGKSLIGRGVIAGVNERLQVDPDVKRVDVIYVCSNLDIAAQNLSRLRIGGDQPEPPPPTRLSLLATEVKRFRENNASAGKPLNLVAFTPGTSFEQGHRTGLVSERALLFLMIESASRWDGWSRRAAVRALQGPIHQTTRFETAIKTMRFTLDNKLDRGIRKAFLAHARATGSWREFATLIKEINRRDSLPAELKTRAGIVTGKLRISLAHAGVDALEPDLIILDEFQRFRYLLDDSEDNKHREAAELAHALFEHSNARVLLLSATPYKPYTLSDEVIGGEDHYRDFRQLLRFLNPDPAWNETVRATFEAYRRDLIAGTDASNHTAILRDLLLKVMTRTERPSPAQAGMLAEVIRTVDDIRATDLRGYQSLHRIAAELQAPITIEYWKSAPYFLNFTEGYQVGHKLRRALHEGGTVELRAAITSAQRLKSAAIERFQRIDPGNARMRQLSADTVDAGWWKLLWLPPSMPHYALGEPFRSAAEAGITKRLLFSSWAATPTAVAGLLSYAAERKLAEGRDTANTAAARRKISSRLDYRMEGKRPGGMSTLALFWPHPDLARACDPLVAARREPGSVPRLSKLERDARQRLLQTAPPDIRRPDHTGEAHGWTAVLRWPGMALPEGLEFDEVVGALSARDREADGESTRLARHVELALEISQLTDHPVARRPDQILNDLVWIGMHGPGNIAWRALDRLLSGTSAVTPAGHWIAAATLASGLRTLFNRPESIMLLDSLSNERVYWRAVLRYCADGGLQSVLDEYLHHLRSAQAGQLDDSSLLTLAEKALGAISLRPSVYRAFDPTRPSAAIALSSRFALRYGGRQGDVDAARPPEIREAFNSPFWPLVLATTSAGQEGIDFHWWCSAIVHWNIPANPVDFEQREGRVHRFGGHAVRRNLAADHREAALRSGAKDVWEAAYEAAAKTPMLHGEFAPYWVYPGAAKIERHVLTYPLSRDVGKLASMKDELALYRLAFGQPRQEDLVALLLRNGVSSDTAHALDLGPPPRRNNA